jgi:hypothetical protein
MSTKKKPIQVTNLSVFTQVPDFPCGVLEIPTSPVDGNGVPIAPVGFDPPLWMLLQDIRSKGVELKGKVAEYAGFYYGPIVNGTSPVLWDSSTDNKNNPDWPVSTNASFIKGSPHTKMQVDSIIGILPGLYVAGDGIASGTTIVEISESTVTLSTANTSTKKKVSLTFNTQSPTTGLPLQPNKSLDKLTFLIMFRLPFRTLTPHLFYDDPIKEDDPNHVNTTSWTYRANQLRTSPLLKLNQRGEQVNGNNKRCDDSGRLLDATTGELNTPEAYLYYNDVSNVIGKWFEGPSLDPRQLTGLIKAAVEKVPVYFYLDITTEGSFEDPPPARNWKSIVQVPGNFIGLWGLGTQNLTPKVIPRRREVELGMYLSPQKFTPSSDIPDFETTYPVEGFIIRKDVAGTHPPDEYYVTTPLTAISKYTVYVRLKYPAEEHHPSGTHTIGSTVFEMEGLRISRDSTSGAYFAAYHTAKAIYKGPDDFEFDKEIQFDNIAFAPVGGGNNNSGVTMGWGFDMGQGRFHPQYKINFQIWLYLHASQQSGGHNEFLLRYKDRCSAPIGFNASTGTVEEALRSLLELNEKAWPDTINGKPASVVPPKTITVKELKNGAIEYPTGWDVTIIRTNMEKGKNGFSNIYSSSVFYQKNATLEIVNANIKITPILEKDRYVAATAATDSASFKAWNTFTATLTSLFGDGKDWLDPSHFTNANPQDIHDFRDIIRGCYDVRAGNAFLPVFNHYKLLKKFNFPSLDIFFPLFIEEIVKVFYNRKFGYLSQSIQDRANAAEKLVVLTIAYLAPYGRLSANMEEAIKTKNLTVLRREVEANNGPGVRRNKILRNLNRYFKQHLYRNIEED